MNLTTTAFAAGGEIPKQYTCSGEDLSPPLTWSNPPSEAKSFVLIVSDPDAPSGDFTHWVLYNIPPQNSALGANLPKSERLPDGALQGSNDFGRTGYGGPCPPPGKAHHYYFRLYALDATLNLKPNVKRAELEAAMQGHILAKAEIAGIFRR